MKPNSTTYFVVWDARGLGRSTRKAFRRWDNAVNWWSYLHYIECDHISIVCGGKNVSPPWPRRRIHEIRSRMATEQVEIAALTLRATERAYRKKP